MPQEKFFAEYGKDVAQLLLTKNILDNDERKENAINAFNTLFSWGVVPIINENDVISTAEIKIGDNDTLSDVVAELIDADLLILLSDIDGLYDKNPAENPDAQLVKEVSEITKKRMTYQSSSLTLREVVIYLSYSTFARTSAIVFTYSITLSLMSSALYAARSSQVSKSAIITAS